LHHAPYSVGEEKISSPELAKGQNPLRTKLKMAEGGRIKNVDSAVFSDRFWWNSVDDALSEPTPWSKSTTTVGTHGTGGLKWQYCVNCHLSCL